jgi:2-dehydro-3-deoxy-D-arabinonate dehydratase
MKLVKYLSKTGQTQVGILEDDTVCPLTLDGRQFQSLSDILEESDILTTVQFLADRSAPGLPLAEVTLLAPIDRQEVWAAGVTYRRSQTARMEESDGAASFYDKVYSAPRPELFYKASPHRVSGPGKPVRIRTDANWNVPEPELTLVLNSSADLVGYTVGNDMSSRDIEGENPLYLPQAKVYDQSCALGPCITLLDSMPPPTEVNIRLAIRRGGKVAFQGTTSVANMARSFDHLIGYLGRDNSFPDGVFLLTGTGIVPGDDFTLKPGDVVDITIDGIGTLSNPVVQG